MNRINKNRFLTAYLLFHHLGMTGFFTLLEGMPGMMALVGYLKENDNHHSRRCEAAGQGVGPVTRQ